MIKGTPKNLVDLPFLFLFVDNITLSLNTPVMTTKTPPRSLPISQSLVNPSRKAYIVGKLSVLSTPRSGKILVIKQDADQHKDNTRCSEKTFLGQEARGHA